MSRDIELKDVPYKMKKHERLRIFEAEKDPNDYIELTNVVVMETNVADVFEFYKTKPQFGKSNQNYNRYIDALYQGGDDFKGGTYEDLFKKKDLTVLDKYENEVFKKFSNDFFNIKSKRRVRSAYDGEWDYDRRYEITPFSKREKHNIKKKSLRLNIEMSFSCFVTTEQINDYGAFVVSLIKNIEKKGISIELCLTKTGRNCAQSASVDYQIINKIKDAGEYLSKNDLLKVFNSIYYRRIGFAEIVTAAEFAGDVASTGLGSPMEFSRNFDFNGTKNTLSIFSCPSHDTQKDIVQLLEKELVD